MRLVHRIAAAGCAAAVLTAVAVAGAGPGAGAAPARPAGAPTLTATQATFLATAGPAARASQRTYGVPASVVLAQSILESGWGGSTLARTAHNYFGMTCRHGLPGPVAVGCQLGPDRYCDNTGCRRGTALFRVYRAAGDSFADHGRQLSTDPRYATAYAHRADPDRFVVQVHRAGYATDPRYAELLVAIMVKYDLYRHDRR